MASEAERKKVALRRLGDATFSKVDKVSAELFSLTYGAVVTQLLKDYEDVAAANVQLEKMGYNMGVRMVDELLAKASLAQCASFSETAEVVAKVGFKMFLGVNVEVAAATSSEFRLLLSENPLAEFVELPEECSKLEYSGLLCGVLRGALEMVQMRVECSLLRDTLWGDEVTEIRVLLKERLVEEFVDDDE
ncbi:trafficking protein particle complex 3 [Emiliania huxleyi CCMP1516]|uniref:Trafficking protein particle complex subunit n=2 Tax=Emiliania huxleyi TaxID=2903 RepID=A0A0D3ICV8_EMIH1|nr:trafficking protein particle complex 3 [Emiliania huxleyi CCMP1516]EOD09093.1 trafficking protein particle complex 3 [Emiliania huxleyi CCMP1516]|mmetsp:Transcript_21638/g.69748  ORF Transcript_21638/g.69748 Transcript_21638/m.69748 type:complete len:191 (-) Transcript_21638:1264-1836(-)|eukprot:XP_005761522.1 trafficking protein particle complex 3 [Emiliania huxleyi CCMP1516]